MQGLIVFAIGLSSGLIAWLEPVVEWLIESRSLFEHAVQSVGLKGIPGVDVLIEGRLFEHPNERLHIGHIPIGSYRIPTRKGIGPAEAIRHVRHPTGVPAREVAIKSLSVAEARGQVSEKTGRRGIAVSWHAEDIHEPIAVLEHRFAQVDGALEHSMPASDSPGPLGSNESFGSLKIDVGILTNDEDLGDIVRVKSAR